MNLTKKITHFASVLIPLTLSATVFAQDIQPGPGEFLKKGKDYSPYVDRNFPENVYWGDTHLHTSYSTDAGMIGNTLGPDQAYRFASGEEVVSSSGQRARLIRGLDFLVVSDHAENLGLAPMIAASDPDLLRNPWGREIHDLVKDGKAVEAFTKWGIEAMLPRTDPLDDPKLVRSIWEQITATADRYNKPGIFTAFIGYEWTSTPEGNNLHRVVLFKDAADRANQIVPFSQYDSVNPEDLWQFMAGYEADTGGEVLAIPHNGNLSNGLMFAIERMNGKKMGKDYATARMRWEPIAEVTQIKGDGEAHPTLSPDDEFADYGTWDKADIAGMVPKKDSMLEFEYARAALKNGLKLEDKTGANPYKFGMIGSTDAHTSLATTREENFFGKMFSSEPAADRYEHYVIKSISGNEALSTFAYEEVGSGLAAVWARENTRASIFDAMQRKEVYATTGTRLTVRFFGGWDYQASDVHSTNVAKIGYAKGVPMGGDLLPAPENTPPTFMVGAIKDPWGANLDRIQIVKGWLDSKGNVQEKVYDVAFSGDRKPGPDGKVPAVGNTVDVAKASYTNDIGSTELRTLWTDPDFDSGLRAFYYARVLEIPTPTWQAYDSQRYGVKMPDSIDMMGQERAYTSPIWYTP
ncbi:MAG: DUF3604 domain-containing protein [Halioglobus sp.]